MKNDIENVYNLNCERAVRCWVKEQAAGNPNKPFQILNC